MQPLVSIIVPIYNNEKYIAVCVKTLLEQTYKNLQIILVDDGSTDSTYEMCSKYQDERILLLKKENGGASSARNYGLKFAKGKYIYFVDSDDYLNLDAVERLVQVAEAGKADCVMLEARNYTEENIRIKKDGLSLRTDYPVMEGKLLILQLLRNKDYHAAPVLYFVRNSVYVEGLQFEEGIMFEDELFSYMLLRKCKKVVCVREKLYNRRVHAGSVMTSTGKGQFRFYSISRVFCRLIEIYEKDPKDVVLRQYLKRIGLLWFDYWRRMGKSEQNHKKQDYESIKKRILHTRGFGSMELFIRCYGYYAWILYIFPGRCIRKIRLRSLK